MNLPWVPPRTVTNVWLRGTCLRPVTWAAATCRGAANAEPGTAVAITATEPLTSATRRNCRRLIEFTSFARPSIAHLLNMPGSPARNDCASVLHRFAVSADRARGTLDRAPESPD